MFNVLLAAAGQLSRLWGTRGRRIDILRSFDGVVRKGEMLRAAAQLRGFDRPALVVWARDDLMMPRTHGARLAGLLPHGRLVEIEDSRTLVPEDQPARLAAEIRRFVAETP